MSSFTLKQDGFTSYTCVANNFIEHYMPKAAGEFVKIYIYLLKCVEQNTSELSISMIADAFENTQKDVVRALKYWEKHGLLKLSFDGNILTSLKLMSVPAGEASDAAEPLAEETCINVKPALLSKHQYSKEEFAAFSEDEEASQLIYIVQKYLGRTLTSSDKNSILFFYDGLKLPIDVIEYLFEYCVSKDKKSMRYIDKTAISWSEKGIDSIEAAKALSVLCPDDVNVAMKAFGLSSRQPSEKETAFVKKWISWGFGHELISMACVRTINTIHQPSFEYADSILKNWHDNNATTEADIARLDAEFADKASYNKKVNAAASDKRKKTFKNPFSDYDQRENDYAHIEKLLMSK